MVAKLLGAGKGGKAERGKEGKGAVDVINEVMGERFVSGALLFEV